MAGIPNNQATIRARREKLWSLLTKGISAYQIAKELNVDHSTLSRDIKFLTAQSQNYLNNLPFMYQTSIEGIRSIMKECWLIYGSTDNNFQRIAVLKLAKECHESIFKLVDEGPSVMYLKQLQERLAQIEIR